MAIPLLDIRDLTIEFATRNGTVTAVKKSISVFKKERRSGLLASQVRGNP